MPATRWSAHEAAVVAELFARYADGGVAIGELARWLSGLGVVTRTGKPRWDRSTVWGMLRNPAYAGRACFGKTMRTDQAAGLNRTARLVGRATPRCWSSTGPAAIGSRYPCPRWSTRTPGSGSSGGWPTTSATPPATAGIPPCCKAFAPAAAAATPTTAPRHAPPTRRSTTTAASARTLPLRARPRLRQQAGARRLPRHRRLEPHHRPACRPGLDPNEINKRLDQVRTARPPPPSASVSMPDWPRPPRRSPGSSAPTRRS